MAEKSLSKAAKTTRGKASIKAEEKATLKLYEGLMAEREPAIPVELLDVIERDINGTGVHAVNRRAAMAYLATPFKKTADAIRTDRETALALAAVYFAIQGSLKSYKSLVGFMCAAEARLMVALAQREDMQEILALAEADPGRTVQ